jgi:hypothetical protein
VVHLEKLYREYRDRVEFAFIYIAEAGHKIPGYEFMLEGSTENLKASEQEQRLERIRCAVKKIHLSIPAFIDRPDGSASKAYWAWPARLVVVGSDGRIVREVGSLPSRARRWDDVARILEVETSGAPSRPEATE